MKQENISLELLMCGGGMSSILLLPFVARCLETIYIYIYISSVYSPFSDKNRNRCMYMAHVFYACCSDCVGVCGNFSCVAPVIKDSGFFEPWSVEVYCIVVLRDEMDVVFVL